MHVRIAALIAFVLALAFAGPAFAQVDDQTTEVVSGAVVSTGNTSFVIRTDDGALRTFVIDTATSMPSGIEAGNRVTVRYRPLDQSRSEAVNVALLETNPEQQTPDRNTVAPLSSDEAEGPLTGGLAAVNPTMLLVLLGLTAVAGVVFLRMLARHAA
jgi:hypothetical protein